MPENELTTRQALWKNSDAAAAVPTYTREQLDLIKRTIAKGATDDELALFVQFCRSKKMDPFSRHLYAIQRREKDDQGNYHSRMVIQTGIDGFRAQAGRNPHYAGQLGPFWCGPDGVWTDVWLKKEPPVAAKVGVLRNDFKEPCWGVALFAEYNAGKGLWLKMPAVMIAKCAEALALRKAFPDELSGIYSTDEIDQSIDITPVTQRELDRAKREFPDEPASVAGAGQRDEKMGIVGSSTPSRPAPAPAHNVEQPGIIADERKFNPKSDATARGPESGEGMGAQGSAPIEPATGGEQGGGGRIPLPPIPLMPEASKAQRQALVKMASQVLGSRKEALAWLQQAGATSNLSVDLFKHLSKQLMDLETANNANVESFNKAEAQEAPDIDF